MAGEGTYRRLTRTTRWQRVLLALAALSVLAFAALSIFTIRYSIAIHRLQRGVGNTVFYSSDGKAWFPLDEHRRDAPLAQISPHLQNAVIAIEDHRFRQHAGIDPIGLGRAIWQNTTTDGVQGGSTLTQQLARTLFLTNKRSYARKLKEAYLALLLEQMLSKDQILELYLNRVYLSGGFYGVETLSRKLFAKKSSELNLAESALIAGLIRAPSALSPWTNVDGAVERSNVVLRRMREEGFITPEQERQARTVRFRMTASPSVLDTPGGYAKEFLREQFRDQIGSDHPPDWKVYTTFSPQAQEMAEASVRQGLASLELPNAQAALVALDPETGDLRALVGGRDQRLSSFNRAVRSRRQPGSAFKPFVYSVALKQGLSPVSMISDLTLRQALFQSDNPAALALQQKVGTDAVVRLAKDVGLPDQPNVPSLALGSGTVTPLALTAAYAIFPNGGWTVEPRGIERILDRQESVAFESDVQRRRVIPATVSFQTLTILQDVVDRGTGAAVRSHGVTFPVGGKTGTTNDYHDAWFVGFSSGLVVGVWVGFDQPAPLGRDAYAARIALPIWADFMRRASRLYPSGKFVEPPGLAHLELCRMSYQLPVAGCPTYTEYLKEGDERPSRLCPLHQGSFKQKARRAIDGVFDRIKRGLRDLF